MCSNYLNFFTDFLFIGIGTKLHKEHNFGKDKQKSMSLNGTFFFVLLGHFTFSSLLFEI